MPPLSSVSSSQLSYEGPLISFAPSKPLHDVDSETSFLSDSNMEVKPRLDLWSGNTNIWSLPTPQQTPKKKGVHFGDNQIHEIIHISDYSAEEIQSCWYTRQERGQSVANRNACVARLDAGLNLPKDEAWEGLERTCETRQSMQHIAQAIHAVLGEQYDQRIFGMGMDPEYIALRYSAVVDSFPPKRNTTLEMPNPVGILTEQSVRYHEVAPMA